MPAVLPQEWDEHIVVRLEEGAITITFKNGKVLLDQGDSPDAESIIQLTNKRFCDIIDGSVEFMTVWREFAEPSPTDRTYILKGSGAKLFAILDGLIKCYKSNAEFKKLLDDYKAGLKT
ncbi:MAG: hypothetical protein AMJ42_02015 [Deltaproteobacteria bacterium DG_8]|nr:MAG: hypothetical protein AMJ42_02015 [Deltaproteobacteria bacterium DG_8]